MPNKAVYLPWGGYVDTEFNFSEFFDNEHTVMCWFMPQWLHSFFHPLIAENGGGMYSFGIGNYDLGNVIFNGYGIGSQYNKAGDPVLFIEIGNVRKIYLVPEIQEEVWQHIAVIKRPDGLIQLYVNGVHRQPVIITNVQDTIMDSEGNSYTIVVDKTLTQDTEIQLGPGPFPNKPNGTLRFGRRTFGNDPSQARWQTYGFLDDVAIFNKTLSANELKEIVDKKILNENEAGLIAYWSFNSPVSDNQDINKMWRLSKKSIAPGKPLVSVPIVIPVSSDRNSLNDSKLFDDPILVKTHVVLKLPFMAGEEWHVNQGMNSSVGSHRGSPAYCYDFGLHNGTKNSQYPSGTEYAPVYCARKSRVKFYQKDYYGNEQESNKVVMKISDTKHYEYCHLAGDSLSNVIQGGTFEEGDPTITKDDRYTYDDDQGPLIEEGEFIAKIGPSAEHLHFLARAWIGNYTHENSVTVPLAFSNFMKKTLVNNSESWVPVEVGFLKAGDVVKNAGLSFKLDICRSVPWICKGVFEVPKKPSPPIESPIEQFPQGSMEMPTGMEEPDAMSEQRISSIDFRKLEKQLQEALYYVKRFIHQESLDR